MCIFLFQKVWHILSCIDSKDNSEWMNELLTKSNKHSYFSDQNISKCQFSIISCYHSLTLLIILMRKRKTQFKRITVYILCSNRQTKAHLMHVFLIYTFTLCESPSFCHFPLRKRFNQKTSRIRQEKICWTTTEYRTDVILQISEKEENYILKYVFEGGNVKFSCLDFFNILILKEFWNC